MNKLLVAVLMILVDVHGCSQLYSSDQAENENPFPLDEVRALYHNPQVIPEAVVVRKLIKHLDQRITLDKRRNGDLSEEAFDREYVMLIRMIAERPYPFKPRGRPHEIRKNIDYLTTAENPKELNSLLNISSALAGGETREGELFEMLRSSETTPGMLSLILDALKENCPIELLPQLLELKTNNWCYTHSPMNVGPPDPVRVFPVRDRVFDCLQNLGIKAHKNFIPDMKRDSHWNKVLTTTVIIVDRAALVAQLRHWVLHERAEIWRPAIRAVKKIPGKDIEALLATLIREHRLSVAKMHALAISK